MSDVVPASPSAAAARERGRPTDPARTALLVTMAHGLNDAYTGFLSPLLPRIMAKMGLSIALAATLAMTYSLASSLLQPAMGWLADRYGRRAFVVGGPLVSAVFVSLIGIAPGFSTLVLLLVLGGLGSAAFHPPATSLAARIAAGGRTGVRFSIFSFGGAAGYALGPLLVVALVAYRGLEGMWIAMVPALLLAPVFLAGLPRERPAPTAPRPPGPRTVLRHLAGPLGLLFGISALAAFAQRVYLTMAPIIVAGAGGSEARGAVALSVYLAAQALGTLYGGVMTDRRDRRRLLASLTFWSVPAHLLALGLPAGSGWVLAAAATAGFLNMALLPPVVVMAQEMLPAGAALGSGIVMGLAWAAGSVGVLGTGVLADWIGPRPAALASVPLLLIAVLLALHPALAAHARRPGTAAPAIPGPPLEAPR